MKKLVVLNVAIATLTLSSTVWAASPRTSCLAIDQPIPVHAEGIYFDGSATVIAGTIPAGAMSDSRLGSLDQYIEPNQDGDIAAGVVEIKHADLTGPSKIISKTSDRASIQLKVSSQCADGDDSCTAANLDGTITISPKTLTSYIQNFADYGGQLLKDGQNQFVKNAQGQLIPKVDTVCVTGVGIVADKSQNYIKVFLYLNGSEHGFALEALNGNRVKNASPAIEQLAGLPEGQSVTGASAL